MPAGPRGLSLLFEKNGADRGQILGKDDGWSKEDADCQDDRNLSEGFQSSHCNSLDSVSKIPISTLPGS